MIGPPPAGLTSQILSDLAAALQSLRDVGRVQVVGLEAVVGEASREEPVEHVRPFLRNEVRVDRRPLELGALRVGLEGDLLSHGVVQVVAVLQAAVAAAVDDRHAVHHHQAVAGAAAVDDQVHPGLRNRSADVLPHAGDQHCRASARRS